MKLRSYSAINDGLFSSSITLERQERELSKPKNWGEITYQRLHKRFGELTLPSIPNNDTTTPPPSMPTSNLSITALNNKKIYNLLNEYPNITGPLDGTRIINELTENEQYEFFKYYNKCQILILSNWNNISLNILRLISITMGNSLLELDLSHSSITTEHIEILFLTIKSLKILKLSSCNLINSSCMKLITQICYKTLQELYLNNCQQFHIEPLLWISGVVGINTKKLSKLITLDLSYCPLVDDGLLPISIGMKLLKNINLEGCEYLTDTSLIPLFQSNCLLEIINLSGCYLITSKSIIILSKSCHTHLLSLNLSRCSKITDTALVSLGKYCTNIQALNFSGLRLLTEGKIFHLIQCLSSTILMLNITGCELVTITGFNSMIQGLPYVKKSKTFFGFIPLEEHIEIKLNSQLSMIYHINASKISQSYTNYKHKNEQKIFNEIIKLNKNAKIIQNYCIRYMMRLKFYYMWRRRVEFGSILVIQRIYRGYKGRYKAKLALIEKKRLIELIPYCIRLQKLYRGKRSRRMNTYISDTIRDLYNRRYNEAIYAIIVRIQAYCRYYLAQKKYLSWKEMIIRKREDMNSAAIIIQNLIRKKLSKNKMKKLLIKRQRINDLNNRSAARIQAFYRASKGKYNSKLTRQELLMIQRRRKLAGNLLGRIIRGYYGRKIANQLRIKKIVEYCAARTIQRIYRGRRVIHWRDMRLNIIASFVLDRQYIERMERTKCARLRYQQYLENIQKDSASESDDREILGNTSTSTSNNMNTSLWIKNYDENKNIYYWIHIETGEKIYNEPPDPMALPKSLINCRVKVLWIVQDEWYEGYITRYHIRKKRYRIEYDDGDHEWLNIEEEKDRIQILNDVGTWVMFSLWKPPLLEYEYEKKNQKLLQDQLRADAYRDAYQWKVITSDSTTSTSPTSLTFTGGQYGYDSAGGTGGTGTGGTDGNDNYYYQQYHTNALSSSSSSSTNQKKNIMFLSTISGIIRTGTSNALDWIIQDDGYGFPCFYNTQTNEIVYEDPRFESNTTIDIENQREYVMQELRYALYFCKDILDRYENAVYIKNQIKINYQLNKILQSNKPKLLTSFLLRAKKLYQQVSVVDQPINENIQKELNYATWISEKISKIIDIAEEYRYNTEEKRKNIMKQVIKTTKETTVYDPMIVKG